MMSIICNLQFRCCNEALGCQEVLIYRDLVRHERMECQYKKNIEITKEYRQSQRAKRCQICKQEVEEDDAEDSDSLNGFHKNRHLCSKDERDLWCGHHKKVGSYYTAERIVNSNELAALSQKL